jgi:hypothetical protein
MISLMHLSEGAHGLVLSYPVWIGIALLLLAAGLAVYAIRRRARLRRPWPIALAVVVAAWAGIYVATFKATVTDEAGSVYAFMRSEHTVRWEDAVDIYLEHRGGGSDWQIVVIDNQRRAHGFDVAELSIEDRDRVMAYMVDRMPASAFHRPPELLKRRAEASARPASFLGDQQI